MVTYVLEDIFQPDEWRSNNHIDQMTQTLSLQPHIKGYFDKTGSLINLDTVVLEIHSNHQEYYASFCSLPRYGFLIKCYDLHDL